jgi:3-oxoacyl-[acyl-carrier protein] reductase
MVGPFMAAFNLIGPTYREWWHVLFSFTLEHHVHARTLTFWSYHNKLAEQKKQSAGFLSQLGGSTMDMGLKGKVALVTGAARGIGLAIASQLADEGCRVAVCDLDLEAAQAACSSMVERGATAFAVSADVSSRASITDAVARARSELGPIEILVNNAGFSMDAPFEEMTEEQWDRVVDVCLKGSWLCAQAVVADMKSLGGGRIINIASRAHLGESNKTNYCAAKAGVLGLTSALSIELGKYGITVNSIAPGLIRTERVLGLRYYEDIDRRAKLSTPIQKSGEPSDIAAAAVYLASSAAAFVSGDTLYVTGGRYSST